MDVSRQLDYASALFHFPSQSRRRYQAGNHDPERDIGDYWRFSVKKQFVSAAVAFSLTLMGTMDNCAGQAVKSQSAVVQPRKMRTPTPS